jgi:beta-glucuronidase
MLAPRESRSRECRRLDGLWRFRFDPGTEGTAGRWWQAPLRDAREMAVPASYNDLVTNAAEREHVGDVWYQRDAWVPAAWEGRRIVLRCDAATQRGTLWAGTAKVADHAGGYTPFEADVTDHVRGGEPLRVTVRVGNELTMATIPPGVISSTADGRRKQRYFHDFFNYAGLHRPVWLYSTPRSYIADISVSTAYDPRTGIARVTYHAEVVGAGKTSVMFRDAAGAVVAGGAGPTGVPDCPRGQAVVSGGPVPVPAGRSARRRRVLAAGRYKDGSGGGCPPPAERAAGAATGLRDARRLCAPWPGP